MLNLRSNVINSYNWNQIYTSHLGQNSKAALDRFPCKNMRSSSSCSRGSFTPQRLSVTGCQGAKMSYHGSSINIKARVSWILHRRERTAARGRIEMRNCRFSSFRTNTSRPRSARVIKIDSISPDFTRSGSSDVAFLGHRQRNLEGVGSFDTLLITSTTYRILRQLALQFAYSVKLYVSTFDPFIFINSENRIIIPL